MNLRHPFRHLHRNRHEKHLLAEINSRLPRGIDWKAGAIAYLEAIIQAEGGHNRRFELVKPFQGGPDFQPFFTDLYTFLNTLDKLALPEKASVLDVGCGAGWVSHYLAKLGFSVTGVDISPDLLAIARERIAGDPFSPFIDHPFQVEFMEIDVETTPVPDDKEFDCVLYMSALHHFFNPIAAIRNTASRLKKNGRLAIVEAAAPEPGSSYDETNQAIMQKYRTLERPYQRVHLEEILTISGFPYFRFYQPVNGLFTPGQSDLYKNHSMIMASNWNIVIAASDTGVLPDPDYSPQKPVDGGAVEFLRGFYDPEMEPEWGEYRWAGPEAYLRTWKIDRLICEIQPVFLDPEIQSMNVFIARDGTVERHLVLKRGMPPQTVEFTSCASNQFCFMADYVFRPDWFNLPDTRLLSYKLRIP
ncbi:class I SAM-dependent methyltransferase [bacterium]|nr:class I SAM-dependent methyltransferase [candidate division CSSED10-310 bacterium]